MGNTFKILFLAANPLDTYRLRLDEEIRAIDQTLRQAEFRNFEIQQHWATQVSDLQEYLLRHQPDIVHFSSHGSKTGELILANKLGHKHPVSIHALSQLFSVLKDNIRCVVLNACYSERQAQAIAKHIDCVIGMSRAIGDSAAISFATAFYRAIGFGRDIKTAFDLGCNEIDLENLNEQDTPKIIALNKNPATISFITDSIRSIHIPFMAPDQLTHFVIRLNEYNQLLQCLLLKEKQETIVIGTSNVALQGGGGFGKTTLARAICHDPRILNNFKDGILWVTLEQGAQVLEGLTKLYRGLTGKISHTFLDIEDAKQNLYRELSVKKCLIVIDDVWESSQVKPFLEGGKNCTRLITTRNYRVALEIGAKLIEIDKMTGEESEKMLTIRLSDNPSISRQSLDDLARRLGWWPLLLELAGAALFRRIQRGEVPEVALKYINQVLDEEGLTAFDQTNEQDRNAAIASSIKASLCLLDNLDQEGYTHLAIFPEGADIPLNVVAALWKLSHLQTERRVERLADLSLIHYDLKHGMIRLHEVLQHYLIKQIEIPFVLHRRLLDAYDKNSWAEVLLEEPYFSRNLFYHMLGAWRYREFPKIVKNFHYLAAKVFLQGSFALEGDISSAEIAAPGDKTLGLLRRTITSIGHLLNYSRHTHDQVKHTLYIRLKHVDSFQRIAADGQAKIRHPYLDFLHPLPDQPNPALNRKVVSIHNDFWGIAVRSLLSSDGKTLIVYNPPAFEHKALGIWDFKSGAFLFKADEGAACCAINTDSSLLA